VPALPVVLTHGGGGGLKRAVAVDVAAVGGTVYPFGATMITIAF